VHLDNQQSFGEMVATVIFWVVVASLSLIGAIAAWRWTRRRRPGARVAAPDPVPSMPNGAMERVIGYVSMSPGTTPADHDRSAEAIIASCREAGRELVDIVCDAADGRPLERPGLTHALGRIAEGQARGLVMSDMRTFSRSNRELGALVEWFRAADATLVALDLDFDTSTPEGRQVATALLTLDGEETDRVSREADAPSEPRYNGRRAVRERPKRFGERAARERVETKG
jgi:DNA invertase Pin-like site-specific DNA recombinase